MASFVDPSGFLRLSRKVQAIQKEARVGSRSVARFKSKVSKIGEEGHTKQLLQGIDKSGRRTASLAPSTLKRRRGSGPPRIPRGASSRMVTAYEQRWVDEGPGRQRLIGYYDSGIAPFAAALENGAPSRNLPARPTGITPEMHGQIGQALKELAEDIRKGGA